jgi:sugar lactone lactonase YvrE
MLQLSPDARYLYLSFENGTKDASTRPSLGRINLATGEGDYLLYGLVAGDGLKTDPYGNVWLGEEVKNGQLWRIEQPDRLPTQQFAQRGTGQASHPHVVFVLAAGLMAHEGLAFSTTGQYLYLLDEWKRGSLYRLNMEHVATAQLQVFHKQRGWLAMTQPTRVRAEAASLGASTFNRGEDMERLPDGRILFAETDTGMIHVLDDRNGTPTVQPFLQNVNIQHPDNLEWDEHRQGLWITDDSTLSELWFWDGRSFERVVSDINGEITGVESHPDGRVWINLQGQHLGEDRTVLLTQTP